MTGKFILQQTNGRKIVEISEVVVKAKIENETWNVTSASSSRMIEHRTASGNYSSGAISTPYGFVDAYTQSDYSFLSFIWYGTWYRRTIQKGYTATGLARIAGAFALSSMAEVMTL